MTTHLESQIPPMAIGSDVWPGLGKTSEEAGELIQVIGKLIAYPETPHPDGTNVFKRLEEEIADVAAAIDYVLWANARRLDTDAVRARRAAKFHRFRSWHHKERGL